MEGVENCSGLSGGWLESEDAGKKHVVWTRVEARKQRGKEEERRKVEVEMERGIRVYMRGEENRVYRGWGVGRIEEVWEHKVRGEKR